VTSIFGQVSSLQMELSEIAGTIRGELNLAAVSTAQYVVPHILARFRARYPEVTIRLRVCNRSQALERLAERRDDLVIMGMVPQDAQLAFMPILDNEMIPVVWPGHPLLTADKPSLEDFARHYVLMREPGSGTRTAFEEFAARERVSLPHTIELGTNEAIKQGIMAHLGVAVLPRLAVQLEIASGLLASPKLPGFPLKRSWCTVYPKDRPPSPVTELFLRCVRELLPELNRHFSGPLEPMPGHGVVCLPAVDSQQF
jgi:DNA-binding transcriptional LysR family regulator